MVERESIEHRLHSSILCPVYYKLLLVINEFISMCRMKKNV